MGLIIKEDCYADYLTISSLQSEGPAGPAEEIVIVIVWLKG